jgi:plasmid maintenance system antidote protein VapI
MPRRDDFTWIEDMDPEKRSFANLKADKITRLGLGPEIIKMKKLGYSASKIAQILGLNKDTTQRFIRNFNALSPKQQKDQLKLMEENSVFNLKDQLEKIYTQTQQMTKLVENNPEMYAKYLAEQRMQLKLASEILEKVQRMETQKHTIEVILECIRRVSPELRKQIMDELGAVKELRGLIG